MSILIPQSKCGSQGGSKYRVIVFAIIFNIIYKIDCLNQLPKSQYKIDKADAQNQQFVDVSSPSYKYLEPNIPYQIHSYNYQRTGSHSPQTQNKKQRQTQPGNPNIHTKIQPNRLLQGRAQVVTSIYLVQQYIQKLDEQNTLQISMAIKDAEQYFPDWAAIDLSTLISLQLTAPDGSLIAASMYTYQIVNNNNGEFVIVFQYLQNVHNYKLNVVLQSATIAPVSLALLILPDDNQFAYFYPQNTYSLAKATRILIMVTACLALFFFLLGIVAGKVVGIQMMSVIQISYLSLICLNKLNPGFKALTNIWFVNGYNMLYNPSSGKQYLFSTGPSSLKAALLFNRFMENYNYTFLVLIVLPLFIALIIFVITKTAYKSDNDQKKEGEKAMTGKQLSLTNRNESLVKPSQQTTPQHTQTQMKNRRLTKIYTKLLFEYTFNGIMFSSYLTGVCFVLQYMYAVNNMPSTPSFLDIGSIILSIIMIVLSIVYSVLLVLPRYNIRFGQFVTIFKNQQVNRRTYVLYLYQHLIIGILISIFSQVIYMHILPICVFSIFIILVAIRRPYKQMRHNIRFIANMLICITIQIIYLVYNIDTLSNSTIDKLATYQALPIFICVLLLICVIYSGVFILYEVYKLIQKCRQDKQLLSEEEQNYEAKQNEKQNGKQNNANQDKNKPLNNTNTNRNQNKQKQGVTKGNQNQKNADKGRAKAIEKEKEKEKDKNKELDKDKDKDKKANNKPDDEWRDFYEQARKVSQSLKPQLNKINKSERPILPEITTTTNRDAGKPVLSKESPVNKLARRSPTNIFGSPNNRSRLNSPANKSGLSNSDKKVDGQQQSGLKEQEQKKEQNNEQKKSRIQKQIMDCFCINRSNSNNFRQSYYNERQFQKDVSNLQAFIISQEPQISGYI